jgi:peroxiredoxin Q/BCP
MKPPVVSVRAPTLLCYALSALAPHAAAAPPDDFTLSGGDKTFRLSQARGKYVALHFLLKTECPYCIRHTQSYAQQAATVPGVIHLFLKPDAPEEFARWTRLAEKGAADVAVFRDPDAALAKQFGVPDGYKFHGQSVHYPALILLGPDGKEVYRYVGKDNADRLPFKQFAAKVAALSRNPEMSHYNLGSGRVVIDGYDPVTYVESGRAEKGNKELQAEYRGAAYRFSSRDHLEKFAADPDRYLPAYGGWCATAMAEGRKVEIDPANFKLAGGRLLLFYKGWLGDARKDWDKDEPGLSRKADEQWRKIAPRDPAAAPR